jgi:hypothetical protein
MSVRSRSLLGLGLAGALAVGTVVVVQATAAPSRHSSVAVQAADTPAHPAADTAARQQIINNVMALGTPSGQVSGVQIKGSTWGDFVSQAGYASQIPNPTAVAPLSTPVYVEMILGKLSFDEPTPDDPNPGQSPWMVSVLNASNESPLFQTAGDPGSSGLPAWYTSMVDQSV